MTIKSKAETTPKGKGRKNSGVKCARAAVAFHTLQSSGFDFINTMLGETIEAVSSQLGIGLPANYHEQTEGPSIEDLALWFAKVPATFDLEDEPKTSGAPAPEALMIISVDDAERLIAKIADATGDALYSEDDLIGAFLLLLHPIVYTERTIDREAYLRAAERITVICSGAFEKATEGLLEDAKCTLMRAALKGGE
jgi:hypothetical protein